MSQPAPVSSIRYDWRRAVNRDYRLTEADRRVLLELESYANPDGTNARPGNERIAEVLATGPEGEHVSLSSVERALRRGRELGYIVQTEKGGRRKVNGVVVKRASVWRLVMPAAVEDTSPVTQMTGDTAPADHITRQTAPHHPSNDPTSPVTAMTGHQSLNHQSISKDQKHSVGAAARAAHPMPEDWEPNKFHASTATRIGVDVHHVATEFRDKMQGQKRKDWGKAFGAYLNAYADGTEHDVFHDADEKKRLTWWADMYDRLIDVHHIDLQSVPAEVMDKAHEVFEAGHTAENFAAAIARHRDKHPDLYAQTPEPAEDTFGDDSAPDDAHVVESTVATVTDMTTARPGPGVAGYPREIEAVICRVETIVGPLAGEERVTAAQLAIAGASFNIIAGDITIARENAALHAEVS